MSKRYVLSFSLINYHLRIEAGQTGLIFNESRGIQSQTRRHIGVSQQGLESGYKPYGNLVSTMNDRPPNA